jgi:CubicO group peptidase (beta-lactamase class C family)
MRHFRALFLITSLVLATLAAAQDALPAEQAQAIDNAVQQGLNDTGVPSASVAVVKDGKLVYAHAYGKAKLDPVVYAKPEMRYSVGSISKQFCATAILMLAEQHKLALDDKVAKYFPDLTRANEVTIRNLLSMTAGYQDYWPQDYVMPGMLKPVEPQHILDGWARKPLDFDPGTKYQYSNTNYVIAGLVVQKVSGQDLFSFLRAHVFTPLGMKSVTDINLGRLAESDPTGYMRYALGPLHPAPKEGAGWLTAAGELAMTASDLAKWDIAMMDQKVLSPASYHQQQTITILKNGTGSRYALGIVSTDQGGRHLLTHDGEVSGFTSNNDIYPDQKVAIVVLTNQDAAPAAGAISEAITTILFPDTDTQTKAATDRARQIFLGLEQGKVDRSQFTDNANYYFSDAALKDFAASLAPCGEPKTFAPMGAKRERGGMTTRSWRVSCGDKTLRAWTYELPDGKLEQYQVAPLQ